jgi:hypothetical protein
MQAQNYLASHSKAHPKDALFMTNTERADIIYCNMCKTLAENHLVDAKMPHHSHTCLYTFDANKSRTNQRRHDLDSKPCVKTFSAEGCPITSDKCKSGSHYGTTIKNKHYFAQWDHNGLLALTDAVNITMDITDTMRFNIECLTHLVTSATIIPNMSIDDALAYLGKMFPENRLSLLAPSKDASPDCMSAALHALRIVDAAANTQLTSADIITALAILPVDVITAFAAALGTTEKGVKYLDHMTSVRAIATSLKRCKFPLPHSARL